MPNEFSSNRSMTRAEKIILAASVVYLVFFSVFVWFFSVKG